MDHECNTNHQAACIREMRTERKYSQQELATLLGESQSVISRMEKGQHDLTTTDVIRLAMAFDTDVDELYRDLRGV